MVTTNTIKKLVCLVEYWLVSSCKQINKPLVLYRGFFFTI